VDEVDQLLRAGAFVDLYRVVRQWLRASVESYSIKKLEPLYGFARALPLREATLALQTLETVMTPGDVETVPQKLLKTVEAYNRDDCFSALHLRYWLEALRCRLEADSGQVLPRPAPKEGEASEELASHLAEVHAVMERLLAGAPLRTVRGGCWLRCWNGTGGRRSRPGGNFTGCAISPTSN
jgi:uncharacterized protein